MYGIEIEINRKIVHCATYHYIIKRDKIHVFVIIENYSLKIFSFAASNSDGINEELKLTSSKPEICFMTSYMQMELKYVLNLDTNKEK